MNEDKAAVEGAAAGAPQTTTLTARAEKPAKRPRGSRRDATLVTEQNAFNAMLAYLMKRRNDAVIYFSENIDVEAALQYVAEKKGTAEELSFFQLFLLGLVRLLRERPELNRYAKGRRLYQRDNVVLNFVAKREFSDAAAETNVTLRIRPEDDYRAILSKVRGGIKTAKDGVVEEDDKLVSAVMRLPRFMLMALFKVLDLMDFYKGVPKDIESIDPIRCSVFVANLGSVGIDAPFHHLFEWGTNSIFVTIGRIKKMPVVLDDGTIVAKTMVNIKVSLDERIADGFYFARSLDLFKRYMQDPASLEEL